MPPLRINQHQRNTIVTTVHMPQQPDNTNQVRLDRSKPIIDFRPWDFHDDANLLMVNVYLMDVVNLRDDSVRGPHVTESLNQSWPGLGTATDGRPVIIHRTALNQLFNTNGDDQ